MEYDILNISDFTRILPFIQDKYSQNFKPISISIKEIREGVSRAQQKYLFGVVYKHLKKGLVDAGYSSVKLLDDDEFDYFMRGMFYYKLVETSKGATKIPKRLRFGKAYKDDVCNYIDALIRFGAQIGTFVPSPTEDIGRWQ